MSPLFPFKVYGVFFNLGTFKTYVYIEKSKLNWLKGTLLFGGEGGAYKSNAL